MHLLGILIGGSCFGVLAVALHVDVIVHYPETSQLLETCGRLRLFASTGLSGPGVAAEANKTDTDTFLARLELPDQHLYESTTVAVLADPDNVARRSDACHQMCMDLGQEGREVQLGAFEVIERLDKMNVIHVWPTFCQQDWSEVKTSFHSSAINRTVHVVARVPAAVLENRVQRPSAKTPPVMFRLNPEWYWPRGGEKYNTWHQLMVTGYMQAMVSADVFIEGVTWKSWDNQPIYTLEGMQAKCGSCAPELQFVCKSWELHGNSMYAGGNHSFGSAKVFFGELYDRAMPAILAQLPARSDDAALPVGVWGYCIGGLAAWNALVSRPDLFNIAYLGSPAMDFNCGSPFDAIRGMNWTAGARPRIYIDAGMEEGELMDNQTLLLFQKLQDKGLVAGQDVFYERAEFGTHQASSFLRRTEKALLALFGANSAGRSKRSSVSQPFMSVPVLGLVLALACFACAVFFLGRLSMSRSTHSSAFACAPLLSDMS